MDSRHRVRSAAPGRTVKVKPTEVRLVSNLLLEPANDSEELAEKIITQLDTKRMKDDRWVIIYQWQPQQERFITLTYGPYNTRKQAERAMSGLVSPGPPLAKGMVCKLSEVPA